jgi:hypothetical protein
MKSSPLRRKGSDTCLSGEKVRDGKTWKMVLTGVLQRDILQAVVGIPESESPSKE